jgi:hypothetical protein
MHQLVKKLYYQDARYERENICDIWSVIAVHFFVIRVT